MVFALAECDIDHSVGPVVHTIGGSESGYRRWNEFVSNSLSKYAGTRNDPLRDGVSRMSAYLHYGMVSPWRLARESKAVGGEGAAKYLDELLIWRELAYAFCFYRPDHDRISAIPEWALRSLRKHQSDKRSRVYSWHELAHGHTEDDLWNTMQRSLLWNGELHNNARMTWGKALLNWTSSPEEALRLLVDLNHRYALDGRDPASYGGILWCLGQFDRPFEPEQPIVGVVRPRSTAEHARRLDPTKYARRVEAGRSVPRIRVAIVGTGISGAIAARVLHEQGLGGDCVRQESRCGWSPGDSTNAKHDARPRCPVLYRSPSIFETYVKDWQSRQIVDRLERPFVMLDQGKVAPEPKSAIRYVGTPSMTAISKELLEGLPLRLNTTIQAVRCHENAWALWDDAEKLLGEFDRVILAIPSAQAAALLSFEKDLATSLAAQAMEPCWMLGITLQTRLAFDWNGAFVQNSPIRWIARNHTKPGRNPDLETLVVHASAAWTQQHMDESKEEVERLLVAALKESLGVEKLDIVERTLQRWRYAIPTQSVPRSYLANASETILACGDWGAGSRVEGAFLSGIAAAGAVLRSLAKQSLLQPNPTAAVPTQLELF